MFLIDNIFKKPRYTGALLSPEDPTTLCYKEIKKEPVSKVSPIKWEYKSREQLKKYPRFYQGSSGSCAAQTVAKLLGVENALEERFVALSARDIYSRGFQTNSGMYASTAMQLGHAYGATLEQLMPSQRLSEYEMRKANDRMYSAEKIALLYRGGVPVALDPKNFDEIAQILARGKAVGLVMRYQSSAWSKPEIGAVSTPEAYHMVPAVDFCMLNGYKTLVFENSWDSWGYDGQGYISENNKMNIEEAWYFEDMPNNWQELKAEEDQKKRPKYKFTQYLSSGSKGPEVEYLQACLKFLGFFPVAIDCTGYYGGITYKAVTEFQKAKNIKITGVIDIATREQLNKIFA